MVSPQTANIYGDNGNALNLQVELMNKICVLTESIMLVQNALSLFEAFSKGSMRTNYVIMDSKQ